MHARRDTRAKASNEQQAAAAKQRQCRQDAGARHSSSGAAKPNNSGSAGCFTRCRRGCGHATPWLAVMSAAVVAGTLVVW
jgi:hypothetical protein